MWDEIWKYIKQSGIISAKVANTLTGYGFVVITTVYGYQAYEKINTAVEKVYIIDYRLQAIERAQNQHSGYIYGLSTCHEYAINNIILIQKETIKTPVNTALIDHIQAQVIDDQKKKLPHHVMDRDTTRVFKIVVKPLIK